VLDLVILLTQSVDKENRSWSLLLLETVHLILNRETPSVLWKDFVQTTSVIRKQFPNASVIVIILSIYLSLSLSLSYFKLIIIGLYRRKSCKESLPLVPV